MKVISVVLLSWSRAQFLNLIQEPARLKSSGWCSPGGSWSISPFQPGGLWLWAWIQENTAQSQALQYSLTHLRHAEPSAHPADVRSWFGSFSTPEGKMTSSKWLKVLWFRDWFWRSQPLFLEESHLLGSVTPQTCVCSSEEAAQRRFDLQRTICS